MRDPGTYGLEELISDVDGSEAYRYSDQVVSGLAGGSWAASQVEPDPDIEWVAVDGDDPDTDVAMSLELYRRLLTDAAVGRKYAGCSNCRRVTEV
jgi:hypothetical protein